MNKPKILIKTVFKDGRMNSVGSKKRRKIFHFFKANNFSNCLIKVNVTYGNGYFNKGVYKNKVDSVNALRAFLEVEI
jgi:hypothetical protein